MQITFREIDRRSDDDFKLLEKWDNDPAIRHLCQHFPSKEACEKLISIDDIKKRILNPNDRFQRHLILMNQEPVGDICFSMDFDECVTKTPQTAWLGIAIGEAAARNRGIGTIAMRHLEQLALQAGAQRFELAVFEFNDVALNMYTKLGYREIQRIPNFTYWNGRMWDDIRLLKEI